MQQSNGSKAALIVLHIGYIRPENVVVLAPGIGRAGSHFRGAAIPAAQWSPQPIPKLTGFSADNAGIEINDIDVYWSLTTISPHLSFGHPAPWNLKKMLVSVLLLIFNHYWPLFFFAIIGYFPLTYANRMISRAPLLTERCGLCFKGTRQVWKGPSALGETHQVRHGRCQNDDAFRNFKFANARLIYCEYRPHCKLSKHVVLPPTPFLPHENHCNMRTYAILSQLPPRLGQMHCRYLVHWHCQATSEPSKPWNTALPLQKTRKEFVRRGIPCDTWRVYAGIKENTSGRAFGGSTGIDLGMYDSLQVSLESAVQVPGDMDPSRPDGYRDEEIRGQGGVRCTRSPLRKDNLATQLV